MNKSFLRLVKMMHQQTDDTLRFVVRNDARYASIAKYVLKTRGIEFLS